MRAAGAVVVSWVVVLVAGGPDARAQPAMTAPTESPAPPSSAPTDGGTRRFALGVDGHLAFGERIESSLAARGELILAPHHAVVAIAGIGHVEWMDQEYDDPTYRELFARIGYRLSSTHIYGGVEVGRAAFRPHWDVIDGMPAHDGAWFFGTTCTALVGWKLGPIDVGFDYTVPTRSIGVYLGAGYRTR